MVRKTGILKCYAASFEDGRSYEPGDAGGLLKMEKAGNPSLLEFPQVASLLTPRF